MYLLAFVGILLTESNLKDVADCKPSHFVYISVHMCIYFVYKALDTWSAALIPIAKKQSQV